jgi:tetratricopeptide (TPR) repeat protein
MKHCRIPSSSAPGPSWFRVLLHSVMLATASAGGSAMAQLDPNKPHDYFAARGTDTLAVVEQYHLGPCQQHFRERDFPRAMSECNFILRIFPNHPTALLVETQVCDEWKAGACLLDEVFERAVAINPKAPGTYVVQGIYLYRAKQYKSAIERFKTALELDPDNLNAHYNIALTYLDTKQYELANRHAQRAYALGTPPPGLRNRLQQAGQWKPLDSPPAPSGSAATGAPAPGTSSRAQ